MYVLIMIKCVILYDYFYKMTNNKKYIKIMSTNIYYV